MSLKYMNLQTFEAEKRTPPFTNADMDGYFAIQRFLFFFAYFPSLLIDMRRC